VRLKGLGTLKNLMISSGIEPVKYSSPVLSFVFSAIFGISLCLSFDAKYEGDIMSSETSFDFYQTTRRYIPEDSALNGRHYEILQVGRVLEEAVLCLCIVHGRTPCNSQ
jgi:hypothetical protein